MITKNFNLWAIGFRPFFLFGTILCVYLMGYWSLAFYNGALPTSYFMPFYWHAHEMIFGFIMAIVAGFLLTASSNWTGTKPHSGKSLIFIVSLWALGRFAFFLTLFNIEFPKYLPMVIDLLFVPSLALYLAPRLIRAKRIRNLQFLVILTILFIANLQMHLSFLGDISSAYEKRGIYLALNLIVLLLVILGGRVTPVFSNNATPGLNIQRYNLIEYTSIMSVWLYLIVDYLGIETVTSPNIALVAFFFNGIRLATWKSFKVIKNPLLFILHAGYFFIVLAFLMIFLSDTFGLFPKSAAIHLLTAGAMGTYIIGMISRVSLGHSGRPIKLAKGFVVSYFLVGIGALLRFCSGFHASLYQVLILVSGIMFALGFFMFVLYYTKILLTKRADGRVG